MKENRVLNEKSPGLLWRGEAEAHDQHSYGVQLHSGTALRVGTDPEQGINSKDQRSRSTRMETYFHHICKTPD